MNANMLSNRRLATAALAGLVLAGCAAVPPGPSADLLQRIESARTRADHEGLAAHFTKEAADARTKAELHRRMARTYQGAAGRGANPILGHCNAIVRSQEALTADYEAMAAAHRDFARQAQS